MKWSSIVIIALWASLMWGFYDLISRHLLTDSKFALGIEIIGITLIALSGIYFNARKD